MHQSLLLLQCKLSIIVVAVQIISSASQERLLTNISWKITKKIERTEQLKAVTIQNEKLKAI